MHWQLRLLCKTKCQGKKASCKTFNKICKTVATNLDSTKPKCHNDNCKHDHQELKKKNFDETPRKAEHFQDQSVNVDQPQVEVRETEQPEYSANLNPVDEGLVNTTSWDDMVSVSSWYLQRAQGREDKHQPVDGRWFMNRMENREDTRHSGDWYLHPRQMSDDATDGNWFMNRMENREDHRHDSKWYFHPHQSSFDDAADWVFDRASYRERQHSQPNDKDQDDFDKFFKTKDFEKFHKDQVKDHQRYHKDQMKKHQRYHKEAQRAHQQFVDEMEQASERVKQMHQGPEWFSNERQARRQYGYR